MSMSLDTLYSWRRYAAVAVAAPSLFSIAGRHRPEGT